MSEYRVRPLGAAPLRAVLLEDPEYGVACTADTVIEKDDDAEWQPTGLLDRAGTPLYRIRSPRKIGFDLG